MLLSDSEAEAPHPQESQNLCDSAPAGDQFFLVHWPHQFEVIKDRIEHIGKLLCYAQNLVYGPRGSTP